MNEIEQKLIMILYECNQHLKRIDYAYKKLDEHFPLKKETYLTLDADTMGFIDQFLFRFSKLQDTMGEKLFPTMLYLLGEDFSKKPFIDMLNRLEKMELLYKSEWIRLRNIRNDVAHEYSFNTEELIDSLNDIYSIKCELISIYDIFYNYCNEKFGFVKNSIELKENK